MVAKADRSFKRRHSRQQSRKASATDKEGIAHFKARTGATWGRKPFITAAQIEKFRELLDSGHYSVKRASKDAGMSNAYFYMNKEAISAWNKGDPWPPPGGLVNNSRKKDRLAEKPPPAVNSN